LSPSIRELLLMTFASLKPAVVLLGLAGAALLCGCSRPTGVVALPIAEAGAGDRTQAAADKNGGGEQSGGDGFRFPDDQGGQLLSKLLVPTDRPAPVAFTVEPQPQPASAAVERPTLPLPLAAANPPQLPSPKVPAPARPAPLPEESPLLSCRIVSNPPQLQHLPAGERVRTPAPDPNQPIPLPVLGQSTPDRASLDDPTADLSLAAALAAPMPSRNNPAPFLRLNPPDPYEHRSAARLRSLPPEEPMMSVIASKPPRP
jgi:hypothetical protein